MWRTCKLDFPNFLQCYKHFDEKEKYEKENKYISHTNLMMQILSFLLFFLFVCCSVLPQIVSILKYFGIVLTIICGVLTMCCVSCLIYHLILIKILWDRCYLFLFQKWRSWWADYLHHTTLKWKSRLKNMSVQ